jgi:hypothetical protein
MRTSNQQLSIVTALLDSDVQVFQTAQTIVPQLHEGAEWLIKNSNSNPSDALQALAASHPRIRLVCEPDKGLYAGLNQALGHVEGIYWQVVGAGDFLMEGAVHQMLAAIAQNESRFKTDSIYFPVYHRTLQRQLTPVPAQIQDAMSCPHPGALLKAQYCKDIGGFNEHYRIASDYDLIGRYLKQWPKVMVGEYAVVNFAGGGMSETRGYECMLETELVKVRIFGKWPY